MSKNRAIICFSGEFSKKEVNPRIASTVLLLALKPHIVIDQESLRFPDGPPAARRSSVFPKEDRKLVGLLKFGRLQSLSPAFRRM